MITPLPTAIVLGAAVRADGSASPALVRRARHAAQLYLHGKVGHIIASGGVVRHPPSEAGLVRDICLEMGVPEASVTVESRSRNTLENLKFSAPLVTEGTQVLLVTDRYHAARAWLAARRLGVRAVVSSPRLGKAPRGRLIKAWLREIPAFLWYLVRPL